MTCMYRQAAWAWSWTQTSGDWRPHKPSALQRVTYATAPPGQAFWSYLDPIKIYDVITNGERVIVLTNKQTNKQTDKQTDTERHTTQNIAPGCAISAWVVDIHSSWLADVSRNALACSKLARLVCLTVLSSARKYPNLLLNLRQYLVK